MKKILIALSLFISSCVSKVTNVKNYKTKNDTTPTPQSNVDSNSTLLGVDTSSVNIFNPSYFSAVEVFAVIIVIILLLCFMSYLPLLKEYVKKKRS